MITRLGLLMTLLLLAPLSYALNVVHSDIDFDFKWLEENGQRIGAMDTRRQTSQGREVWVVFFDRSREVTLSCRTARGNAAVTLRVATGNAILDRKVTDNSPWLRLSGGTSTYVGTGMTPCSGNIEVRRQ